MSEIIFYYGVMRSGKTAKLIEKKEKLDKLNSQTNKIVTVKPSVDSRSKKIRSRNGKSIKVNVPITSSQLYEDYRPFYNYFDDLLDTHRENNSKIDLYILIDEAQFIEPKLVRQLARYYDSLHRYNPNCQTHIYAYGLLKDFKGNLFASSREWLEHADKMLEIPASCEVCDSPATYNALMNKDNKLVPETFSETSNTTVIGDSKYHSLCSKHWLDAVKEAKGEFYVNGQICKA